MDAAMQAKIAAAKLLKPMPGTTARPLVPGMPLHIDGDYLAYYCAGNDETTPDEARQRVVDRIRRGCEVSGADPSKVFIHLSTYDCDKGLRFLVTDGSPTSKEYQGQRDKGRKPQNWQHLRDWMDDYSGTMFSQQQWRDREADDGMAYVSEAYYRKHHAPAAVMTADKDMRMFAGLHIVWKTFATVDVAPDTFDLWQGDLQYGHKWFWQQMLMGDTADFILGLPGVGKVAALKTTAKAKDNEDAMYAVLDVYKSKMGDEYADHFVEQAALLWMRTDPKAKVDNFMTIMPHAPVDIRRAVQRMVDRVASHPGNTRVR